MKKIITLLLLVLTTVSTSYSQPTMALEKGINEYPWAETGVYYKDLYNVLDPFVGTYTYTNPATNTSFKIILQKKTSSLFGSFYQDMLIGTYQYIENGVTKVDELNDLITNNYTDGRRHFINGYMLLVGNIMGCADCAANEIRVHGSIQDPVSGSVDDLIIRKIMVNGQEAISIFILHSINYRPEGSPPPIPISYPLSQDIVLLKD